MKKSVKVLAFVFSALILSSFLIGVVSAAPDAKNAFKPIVDMFSGLIQNIYEAVKPVLVALIGSAETAPEFMGKILIAILLFSITYSILAMTNIFGNKFKWTLSLSSLVVALLGVRWLNEEWIKLAALPSQAYAVALTALVPFIAFGFIILKFRSRTARKLSWILFGVAFLILWLTRDELGTLASTVYPLAAIACILMVWLDGTLKQWQNKIAAEKAMTVKNYQKYLQLLKERDEKYDLYIEAIQRFGANDIKATTLKTDLDKMDIAIQNILP
jgi:hypothetical protein